MLNSNIPINQNQNLSIPMRSAGMNTLPIGTFDASQYTPQYTPIAQPAINQPSQGYNAETLRALVLGSTPPLSGLKEEWSPVKTGNTTADYFLNLLPNALHDIPEIATGAVSMLSHPIQNVVNPISNWATNVAPYESYGERLGDIVNTLGAKAAGLDVKKQAEATKKLLEGDIEGFNKIGNELRKDFIEHFRKDPLITTSILFPEATASVAGKAVRGTGETIEALSKGKVAWGSKGKTAGRIQDLSVSEVAPELINIRKAAVEMVDEAKKAKGNTTGNIAQVLDSWERGVEVPEHLKGVEKAWAKMQEQELKLLPAEGLESAKTLSMNQWRARERGITYNEAARDFLPLEEILYDGIETGNPAAIEAKLTGLKSEEALKNTRKKISELSDEELSLARNYLEDYELNALREADMTIRDARNYLAEKLGETRRKKGTNLTEEQQIRYKENLNKISEMAANGDAIAADFIEAHSRFNNGLLKPVLHAGVKDVEGIGTLTAEELSGRRFAGKGSSREYGTATPEQIAEAYANSLDETIMNIAEAKLDRHVADTILRGEFADGTPLVNETTKKAKYLDSTLLEDGRLKSALSNAKDEAFAGSIAIDETFLNALKNQFSRIDSTPFTGVLKDGYGLLKDAVLNSGFYLGGNALSGAANAIINSNAFLFDDLLNAVKTKGQLSQKLGTYRSPGMDTRKFKYGFSKGMHNVNRAVGGKVISAADAAIQDIFSEIATHANLRKQGIKSSERLNAISEMPKLQLADLINDVRNVSLLNPSRRVIPSGLTSITGMNPFFNWQITAAQSSFHTLMNHPLISQLIAANVFGTIGFDKELQNRLGVGVKSDRQLVSYRVDNKTGETKEINMDFLPQLTFTKAIMEPASLAKSVPLIGDLLNAAQGKNSFGKPFKRTHGALDGTVIQGDNRYRRDPNTGEIKQIGGMPDEVLATLLKDISGVPNIVNKTVLPTMAGIANLVTGSDRYRFYQPYGQSVFGSFSTGQEDNPMAFFMSGNPMSGRAGEETVRSLLNQYEQTYYPENQARINKAFYKGMGSLLRRENKSLMNRY